MNSESRLARIIELVRDMAAPASLEDPNLNGDVLCWCVTRGPFAKGPHDERCVELRELITDGQRSHD